MSGRGLLLLGHGSARNTSSGIPVRTHAERMRERGGFDEVHVGFWKEEPAIRDSLAQFSAGEVFAVPVFMSNGYYVQEVIPREMKLEGPISCIDGRKVRYTRAVGDHELLADVIVQRAFEAGATPGDALAVLGHGTPRNPESERNIYRQAGRVQEKHEFAEVTTVFIDQEPTMDKVFDMVKAERIVMVPLFVADGWHVEETIPEDMGMEGNQLRNNGRTLIYAKAVGTHPGVADIIETLVEDAASW